MSDMPKEIYYGETHPTEAMTMHWASHAPSTYSKTKYIRADLASPATDALVAALRLARAWMYSPLYSEGCEKAHKAITEALAAVDADKGVG